MLETPDSRLVHATVTFRVGRAHRGSNQPSALLEREYLAQDDILSGLVAQLRAYISVHSQGLTDLSPEERNRVYKMMRLHFLADREGRLTAEWGCNVLTTPRCSSAVTTPVFKFHALLTEDGAEQIELARV